MYWGGMSFSPTNIKAAPIVISDGPRAGHPNSVKYRGSWYCEPGGGEGEKKKKKSCEIKKSHEIKNPPL